MKKIFVSFLIISSALSMVYAQSGRPGGTKIKTVADTVTEPTIELTIKEMFAKAVNYVRDKITEFEKKKIPYSRTLHKKILEERKDLAKKYATQAKTKENLEGEDFYYLGRLHWLAADANDAAIAFEKFLETENANAVQMQTARSVLVVIFADQKDFEKAEKFLAEYSSNKPTRMSELAKMEKQLAHNYRLEKNLESALKHSEETFRITQELLYEKGSRARALSQFLDAGITTFEIHSELGNQKEAETTLVILRQKSLPLQAHGIYYKAVDEHIKYLISTGRKPLALELYKSTLKQIPQVFNTKSMRKYVSLRFRKREKHYKILGETAPPLVYIDKWLPNKPQRIADLKGKVILLDFWATWCVPCIEAFPSLNEWHKNLKDEGFVILGVTRYYGEADGVEVDQASEIKFLERFKKEYTLPYPFAVANNQANQYKYGAVGIPTAVLIDRKGIIRYVASGTSKSREEEIYKMIKKLLAEK